jgi:hypothetical protein
MDPQRQQRTIVMEIAHPVTVTLVVTRADSDGEWKVDHVVSSQADVTPTSLGEELSSDEWGHLTKLADAAAENPR